MARSRSHLALLLAVAWSLLPKEGLVFVHHTARTSWMPRVVLHATGEDRDSGIIELAPPALDKPAATEDPPKEQMSNGVVAADRRSRRSGWHWAPRPEHVGAAEDMTERPEFHEEDEDPIQRQEVRSDVKEAAITDAVRSEAARPPDGGRAGSDSVRQTTASQAKRQFTAEERQALRLPVVDEQKLAFEQEDKKLENDLGPVASWAYRKCQPRKWGPHGVLQFKLLFFAFMWVFMMSVSPYLIDIFNRIERHMP
mmetsp:Transcript_27934/g.54946  ORF Transcript_27934/g.54946 Transcript_27934/m.54946 type:complete len:254 (-) Transcript_27934:420-1181(-)